jgi:hypothetical protein
MALESFKILYILSPPCLNDLVVLKNSKYSYRYSNIVEIGAQLGRNTEAGKNTDVNRIAKATKSILKPEIRQNRLSQESGRTVKNK